MRQVEAAADAAGLSYDTMMQNAGRATALRVLDILAGRSDVRVTVLVGPGNNGGDGLVAGRIIAQAGAPVRFYLLKARGDDDANYRAVRDAGLFMAFAEHDGDFRVLRNMVASADVVVDALFGIGVKLPIKREAEKVLRNVRQALSDAQQPAATEGVIIAPGSPRPKPKLPAPYVVAVDCPSGLECDTGALDKNAIPAHETITFIAAKPGLFQFPGAAAVGDLRVATIGVPPDLPELKDAHHIVVDSELVRQMLPTRPLDGNKGTFGKALVVAGSLNYMGAPGLAAMAAYRSGVGLVTIGTPAPVAASLAAHLLEPTWLLLPHDMGVLAEAAAPLIQAEMKNYDALLLGPGWGRETATRELLMKLLRQAAAIPKKQGAMGFGAPVTATNTDNDPTANRLPSLVVDADALNLLSEIENGLALLPDNTIITPHPGEMARLAKREIPDIQARRWEIAAAKAAEWKVVLVLKGAHTLIAAPDGRVAVLPFKTDALATAGTGDVLAGAITGFLAQGLSPYDAALVGAYMHGLAGQVAAERQGNTRSVIAGDVVYALGQALSLIEHS
jgi:NAD(P)H-hydrate epimerase